MDWKSSLESLKSLMPEGEEVVEQPDAAGEGMSAGKHPRVDIVLDRKGRKGKEATIIGQFVLDDAQVDEIAAKLKQKIGTGGSARGGEILIQGDKRRQALEILSGMGFKARII